MYIREYEKSDEQSWIRCRVLSFMGSSYFDDVQNFREEYNNPALRLVAMDNNQVIGFLDIEYEENLGDVCYFEGNLGGVMWNLGVLPEYRHKNVATNLWCKAKAILKDLGIKRVEVWTQDDKASNRWYIKQGFKLKKTYLNAFVKGNPKDEVIQRFINLKSSGEILGIRSFNFEAPIERKDELEKICYRLHEVRGYEKKL